MKRTILMTGGGTLGPVTPLIAVAKEWQRQEPGVQVEWIGTPDGPERNVVERYGYHFQSLFVPKLSRHAWWTWPAIPFQLMGSCYKALDLLKEMRPDIVFTAGGFTSVPIVWTAKLLGIPAWVHQLDIKPGLANELMAPAATRVSVTWEESAAAFGAEKTLVVGGMVRPDIREGSRERFLKEYKLDPERKTVLVFGGGTGAAQINNALMSVLDDVTSKMNVIHLTGKGKMEDGEQESMPNYVAFELLNEEMKDALAAADVVVARAGMGTILELVALQKPSVLIPIPNSHQEANARAAQDRQMASVIYRLTPQLLKQEIVKLTHEKTLIEEMKRRLRKSLALDAERKIVKKALELV